MPSQTPEDGPAERSAAPGTVEVRGDLVLAARRRPLVLETLDGLRLVGELALPPDRDPVATLVCLHPLPTAGGFMDSHLLRKASYRLPALAGIAVLRFNTRGTSSPHGTSEGTFDAGVAERHDVVAAIEAAEFADDPPLPHRWLLGWSFGTDLALMHGCDPSVDGAILLSPPLRYSAPQGLAEWAASGKPLLALVPELDDYLRPAEAAQRFAVVPQAEVVGVPGAKHLWVGETYVRIVLDAVVGRLLPGSGPLPRYVPQDLVVAA